MKKMMFLFALAVANILLFCALPVKAAVGINVDYHTQDEIKAYIKENGATLEDKLTFREEPQTKSPYAIGSLSKQTLDSAVRMINQMRYIAGLSYDVKLSDNYNQLTQAAALSNYLNGQLSHFPSQPKGMKNDMYEMAYKGASSSNIAWASWENRSINETIVFGWMEDAGGNMSTVGHRRWILNPKMGATGFGAVTGDGGTYSAMYAFDGTNIGADKYGVVWPAQNMPVEYFNNEFPWSISMGTQVNDASVKVTLTRKKDGKVWRFSSKSADGAFYVNNAGYGQSGCIIFYPEGISSYEDGDSYDVSIEGLSSGNVSYTVKFFTLKEKTPNASNNNNSNNNNSNNNNSNNNNSNNNTLNKKVTLQPVKLKDKKAVLTWKKQTNISGYEIYMSKSEHGTYKKIKTIKSGASTQYTTGILANNTVYYFKIRAYKSTNGKKVYGPYSTFRSLARGTVQVKPATLKSVTIKDAKAVLTWMRQDSVSGYIVYMAKNENGPYKAIKGIKKCTTTKYTTGVLAKGQTYYFKVRPYKNVSGKRVYGAYSGVKTVKRNN